MMRRRGFTLIEVLITIVLMSIVGIGLTNMLRSQTRFFSRETAGRDARSVTRNALNLVRSELRMAEPAGVTAASASSVTIRVPYRIGLYCSASNVTFVPVDSLTKATAVIAGYAYKDTSVAGAYTYVANTTALATGASANCTAVSITPIPSGDILVLNPAVTLTAASPVFLYQTITYSFAASTLVPGRTALWRSVAGGTPEEIAVPFNAAGSSIRFYVSGATASTSAVPGTLSTITGLEFVMKGESERNVPGTGSPRSAETRMSIFFRNKVN